MTAPVNKLPFPGFSAPEYTPVPNMLFDELLPQLSGEELRVLLYVIRRSFGRGSPRDTITLSQLCPATGLGPAPVTTALTALADRGLLSICQDEVELNFAPGQG